MSAGVKLTHEEFLKRLWDKNEHYRNGEFEIVDKYEGILTTITIKNKYGLCNFIAQTLLNNNNTLDIRQAVNKKEFLLNKLKDLNKNLYTKTVKILKVGESRVLIETIYGVLDMDMSCLFRNKDFSILSAVDKTSFWIKRNSCIREDFNDIDYSMVDYINNSNKVKLRCKLHNYTYYQRPSHHTAGTQGCIHCMKQTIMYTKDNFESHKEFFKNHYSYLYVLELRSEDEFFYKVGITAENRIDYRINQLKKYYDVNIKYLEKGLSEDKYNLEQRFLKEFENYKYMPKIRFTGYTECLTTNPVEEYYDWFNNYINNE